MRRAFDRGIRFFDTAPTYGSSEVVIGRALARHRDDVWLATKVGPRDDPIGSLEGSLRRLGTDRVELLLLHEAGEGFERSLDAMCRLRESGRALHLGLSNATPQQILQARELAGIDAYQGPYNLFDRDAEQRILPACLDRGIEFLAYRPLASGLLSGTLGESPPSFEEADHRNRIYWFRGPELQRRRIATARLQPLAESRHWPLSALALAWVLARPGVRVVLAGARTSAQVDQNVRALDGPLDPEEVTAIDAIVEDVFRPPVATAQAGDLAAGWESRERFIVEHLNGEMSYEAIAARWSDREAPPMIAAQVKVFADQLLDRGLAVASEQEQQEGPR